MLLCSHNGEKYIYSQIESLIHQSKLIDCIHVYDFNSSDRTIEEVEKTREILINYSTIHLNVIQVREKPGVNKSFFYALKDLSSKIKPGDHIFLCDQDDIWLPSKNETVYKVFRNNLNLNSPIILHHDVYVVDKFLVKIKESYYDNSQKKILNSGHAFNHYFGLAIGHTICMNYIAANRLSSIDYDKNILMYDWYWSSIIENLGFKYFIDKPLSKYRQHESNLIGAHLSVSKKGFRFLEFLDHTNNVAQQILLIRQIEKESSICCLQDFVKFISEYKYFIFRLKNFKTLILRILIDCQIIKNNSIHYLGKIFK